MVEKKKRKTGKDGDKTVQAGKTGGNSITGHSSAPPPSVVPDAVFDADKYRHHVAHLDMPDDRKAELLFSVWQIMQSFVDRAFGDDPVQLALAARHVDALDEQDESAGPSVVGSSHNHDNQQGLTNAFRPNAAGVRGKEDSSA